MISQFSLVRRACVVLPIVKGRQGMYSRSFIPRTICTSFNVTSTMLSVFSRFILNSY